jgi:hypothetical protein
MTPQELLGKHGIELPSYKPDRYYTTCPQCSRDRSNVHQSNKVLGVTIEADGSVRWGCIHCNWKGPQKGNGGDQKKRRAYVYRDREGMARFRKVRNLPDRTPRFWLERPDGNGGWRKGIGGADTQVIYRADEVAKAIAEDRTIACVEGEKDADNLWAIGIAATCNAHGASEPGKQPKWTKAHSEQLAGADIVVFNDNDAAGYAHAETCCKLSLGLARRVRRLDLAPHWAGMIPKGGDVSDWLDSGGGGGTEARLRELIEQAPVYVSGEKQADKSEKSQPKNPDGANVDGAQLLDDVHTYLCRFIHYPSSHAAVAHTTWVAHTHLMPAWESTPRLAFLSPEPESGKTRSLEATEPLVPRAVNTMNSSAAYLFRKCGSEEGQPTVLFDEIDTIFGPKAKEHEDIRAFINSGHRRGAKFGRCVVHGSTVTTEEIESYAPVALAGLGWLPDTILSRSIVIRMRKRLRGEHVEPFRHRIHTPQGQALCGRLASWARKVAVEAEAARPVLPVTVEDRQADAWEPLIAVADIVGGDWPELARKAAEALVAVSRDRPVSLNLRLLGDLRAVFFSNLQAVAQAKPKRLATKKILEDLCALDEAPWSTVNKGEPFTPSQLAFNLRDYEVRPDPIREHPEQSTAQVRGYKIAELADAWRRYLQPLSLSAERP